jgi:hypothetical protein
MDTAAEIVSFLAKAIPVIVEMFQAHDRNEAAALAALDQTLAAARRKARMDLLAKHGKSRDDEDTAEQPLPVSRPR